MVDSASTSREVCLHIANKQGLSDRLGFSLQVAVYDKVLARGFHPPPASFTHTGQHQPLYHASLGTTLLPSCQTQMQTQTPTHRRAA